MSDGSDNINEFTFVWRVENFCSCPQQVGEFIDSPTFTVEILDFAKFHLRLYPRGETDASRVECGFGRSRDDEGPESVVFQFTLSIAANGLSNKSAKLEHRILTVKKGSNLIKKLWITRKDLFENEHFLSNDALTLECNFCFESSKTLKFVKYFACSRVLVERHHFTVPVIFPALSSIATCKNDPHEYSINVPFRYQFEKPVDFELVFRFKSKATTIVEIRRKTVAYNIPIYITCKASLPNIDEEANNLFHEEHCFRHDDNEWQISYSINDLMSKLFELGNTFYIFCELSISDGTIQSFIEKGDHRLALQNSDDLSNPKQKYSVLKTVYADKKFSDVNLKAGTETYPAHKCVLSAKSPVFNAMFECDMKEKETSVVDIEDLSGETLKQMLNFIYTDTINGINQEKALELYSAGNKYQIPELKQLCSSFLVAHLSTENVCDILEFGDLHQDQNIESAVRNYINCHANKVFRSDSWKKFMDKRIELAGVILHQTCIKLTETEIN